jgi:hypothetical protein
MSNVNKYVYSFRMFANWPILDGQHFVMNKEERHIVEHAIM